MKESPVAERVIKVFADFKSVDPSEINVKSTFEELGFDSLDGLNIIFELEEEFDISVPDETAQQMGSVSQVIEAIEELLASKQS
ncbi:MAG: acyl carrier protein [Acidobacteria bacterium]|nr:acyl carrier protein [Acidobacteriota bacterium]